MKNKRGKKIHAPRIVSMRISPERCVCAWCYAGLKLEDSIACDTCKKRHYCGDVCKDRDLRDGRHETWCGKAGEMGCDFEIIDIQGKGKGVVALRCFKQGERIMTERPLLYKYDAVDDYRNLSKSEQDAVLSLVPATAEGDISDKLAQKFKRNAMACADTADSCLCINMPRVNHSCIFNATHHFIPELEAKVLQAEKRSPFHT